LRFIAASFELFAKDGAHQELSPFAGMLCGVNVKLSLCDSIHHVLAEHQMMTVATGNQGALCAVQALGFAGAKEAFDFFVHATHGQNFAVLIDRTRDRNILFEWQA
jgi:hypothetical protein